MTFRKIALLFTPIIYCLLAAMPSYAQAHNPHTGLNTRLVDKVKMIADTAKGTVGFTAIGLDFEDSAAVNGSKHLPMQSVYKFPLAIYILKLVETGKLTLEQSVHAGKNELHEDTWSPLVDEHPNRDVNITVGDLLRYAVSKSDNNACDILFGLAGGTAAVHAYIQQMGIKDMAIVATEQQMHKKWKLQYDNYAEPQAMAVLLRKFYDGKLLNRQHTDNLMQLMVNSENSPNRIKGLLPASAVVAHKTGTSGTEKDFSAATNDIAIITLPNGKHYALVVFLSDFKGGVPRGEHIIATISKAVWDHYTE
jgi:beta-lactamase class A